MRLLRRYICVKIHVRRYRLVINRYEIATANNAYLYVHGVLMYMNVSDQFDYRLYRRSRHAYKICAMPSRLIHFAYPSAIMFNDNDGYRFRIEIGENGELLIEKYSNSPY